MRLTDWLASFYRDFLHPLGQNRVSRRNDHFNRSTQIVELMETRRLLSGQTITVDVSGDANVTGHITLRNAIATANSDSGGGDTIVFDPSVTGTITLTQGELAIENAMSIVGPGSGILTISGNNASRIFDVSSNSTFSASISGLTLTGGNCATSSFQAGLGGAIYSSENLTLLNNVFTGNSAHDGGGVLNAAMLNSSGNVFSGNSASIYGGGVYNGGTLTSSGDTFSNNTTANGGGIENQGTVTAINDTFSGNTATNQGGGIDNEGTLTSTGNTFTGNSATNAQSGGAGGGIYNFSSLISTNDTIFDNTAANGGGIYNFVTTLTTTNDTIVGNIGKGVWIQSGTWNSLNTIVAGNVFSTISNAAADVNNNSGTINASFTLIGDASSAGGITNGVNGNVVGQTVGNIFVTDVGGNPILASNDGPTKTISLRASGPAVGDGGGLTTLTGMIDPVTTSIPVASSTFVAVGDRLRIDNEIVVVTAVPDGTHLTVQRDQSGGALSHSTNAIIVLAFDATGATRVNSDLGAMAEINHAPSGAPSTVSTFENKSYTLGQANFGFTDTDDTPSNTLHGVSIAVLPTLGTLMDNGVAVTAGQIVGIADIKAGKLVFTPNLYVSGGSALLCQFQVQDNGGTANGGVNLDPTPKELDINIIHVNQAPIGTSGTVAGVENHGDTLKVSDFGFTDPNDGPSNLMQAVRIVTLPTAGTFTDNGAPVTAGQLVSASDISGGQLVFTPTTNLSGTYFLCRFQVQDDGGTANGGKNLDATIRVLDISLAHVNRAPIGTTGTVSVIENVPYKFKTTDFGFTDSNDAIPGALMAVKFTSSTTLGTLTDNGVAVSAGQFVSATDIQSGNLVLTPRTNLTGGPYTLWKFQVQDNGGTANGGVDLDPTPKILYGNFLHTNHAPSGTTGTVTVIENVPYKFKMTDFGFSDPNDTPANSLFAVRFTTSTTLGTLTDNGSAVSVGQFVSATDISSGNLVFTPKSNLVGGPYTLWKFQVQDNGGTANGGINLDPVAKILYGNFIHTNHAPTGTTGTVNTVVNTPYTFKTADFGFSDPNDTPANKLMAVRFTTVSTLGTLTDSGVAVSAGQYVSADDISNGRLVFTPRTNLTGGPYTLWKFQVQDNGGTANGGIDLDPTPKILYIKITPAG